MQNIFKKIVSLFFCISILISVMCVPASAADDSSIMQDFWEWNVQTSRDAVDVFWKAIYGDDWLQDETRSKDELEERYNQYVSDLQTDLGTTTLIDGGVRVYFKTVACNREDATVHGLGTTSIYGTWTSSSYSGGTIYRQIRFGFPWNAAPFNCMVSYGCDFSGVDCSINPNPGGDLNAVSVGDKLTPTLNTASFTINGESKTYYSYSVFADDFGIPISFSVRFYADLYPLDGSLLPAGQDITVNSRPSSITGDYGILGDDGTIIKVDKTIVDEGHSIVYNPVTNTTYNYTDYVYDYFDRSYNLTLEDGSTMKVVYGDENVTIQEGDTVYNVYYLTSGSEGGSGSGGSGDNGSGGIGGAIGGLFDVLGEIIYGLIEGTINLATKALSALTGLLDLLKQFGESIISFFGGYTDFLGAVFPFLPEETFTILNLGLILMIAAAVFKKFL